MQLNRLRVRLYWSESNIASRLITGRNEVLAKVIFLHLSVILFTGGGVPAPNFRGGAYSKFSGGVPAPNFGGGCLLQIWGGGGGGGACSKFSGGCLLQIFGGGPPIFGIRSPFGRYASYWNAFLFIENSHCAAAKIKERKSLSFSVNEPEVVAFSNYHSVHT